MTTIRDALKFSRQTDTKSPSKYTNILEDDNLSDHSGQTFVQVEDIRGEFKNISELLEENRLLRLRVGEAVRMPPAPIKAKGEAQSFEDLILYATLNPKYARNYKAAKAAEEKNNITKINMLAYLHAVKNLSKYSAEDFEPSQIDEYYELAGQNANSVIATWTLHAEAEKMTLNEYVNRYAKIN